MQGRGTILLGRMNRSSKIALVRVNKCTTVRIESNRIRTAGLQFDKPFMVLLQVIYRLCRLAIILRVALRKPHKRGLSAQK